MRVLRGVEVVPQAQPFESQLPFTSFKPTENLAFFSLKAWNLRPSSIEHVDSNRRGRTLHSDHAEMTSQILCCPMRREKFG